MIHGYVDDTNVNYGSGSASVVLECTANSYVNVVTRTSGNFLGFNDAHGFSGFLLTKL